MPKKQIILQNEKVEYSLRESARARCLRVTIYPGGELAATLPQNFSLEQLENFLHQRADWILHKMNLARKRKPSLLLPRASHKEYLARKKEAFELVENKIDYFRSVYNLCPARISIRNQKTRWGSCSRKGNLNFNYRIVHLPEKYLDYVVVHELCHLKEFNHAKKFWELVAQAIPEYKKIRKEIRNL
jgi:predicted metal-dependent hydrolase